VVEGDEAEEGMHEWIEGIEWISRMQKTRGRRR
jgi:hypothetical protein